MTKKEQQTIDFYDEKAEQFIESLHKTSSFWQAELDTFCTLVPQGHVLDIGVGKGVEASMLIKAGYEYTGVEPAEGLRKKLQQIFPDKKIIQQSVYDWNLVPHSFDGFWCSAMLLHIPKENIDYVLQQIKKVMKPGAIGFISLAEGSGEYFDENTGRYFYLYDRDQFADILKQNGFVVKQHSVKKQDTHRQWLRTWLTYFVEIV